MNKVLIFIKKIIPKKLFKALQPSYHYVLNFLAALVFGFPSRNIIIVGVTGTTGKTSVVYMTAELLKYAGLRVGYTSTAMFSDGEEEWLNDKKMTMLGRFFTQKMLRKMVRNKCDVAIVETTSEGIVQYRHRFINYDIALFTGIYPEHIDSHGSFENYKKAKQQLFEHISYCKNKNIKKLKGNKTIIVNLDDDHAKDFISYDADKKIGFTQNKNKEVENIDLEKVVYSKQGTSQKGINFLFDDQDIQMNILGDFNSLNATAAGCVGKALNISNMLIKESLEKIKQLPGRIERIDEGQNFEVIVDYAFEPVAVTKLYEAISVLNSNKIIHVLGSTGGGRDVARRGALGRIAGEMADYVIVTNEDPYDDDPMEIINGVAEGAPEKEKKENKDLFLIEDRGDAIAHALSLAKEGDTVLITGKGSEQAMAVSGGRLIPWDDRVTVRKELHKLKQKNT